MKIRRKRLLSLILVILMLFSVIPTGTITVSAAGGVKSKLDSIISSYPSGGR